jgi:hypothetical protein
VKRAIVVLVCFFVAAQLYRPARTNPPNNPSERLEAKLNVPQDIDELLDRACNDCHSNETRWPWYSHVAPTMWLLGRDVREGRAHWNRSRWDFTSEEGADVLDEMCEEVKEGAMPLPVYLWLHREARLSDADIRRLCEWTSQAANQLLAGP